MASALLTVEQGAHKKALSTVHAAIARIESLAEPGDETFASERERSIAALRELEAEIEQSRPVSPIERLEQQLQRAVHRQEFERAADLRDRIRDLKSRQPAA